MKNNLKKSIDKEKPQSYTVKAVAGNERRRERNGTAKHLENYIAKQQTSQVDS